VSGVVFFFFLKKKTRSDNVAYSEFTYDPQEEGSLVKELVLQVRKSIGPFAAPKKIIIVPDLPKTRSGKVSFCACVAARGGLGY
jgi:acyl-coenzyme A synthetase/AMP-(fatty) acid ligase